jgi:D-ribose pyranase
VKKNGVLNHRVSDVIAQMGHTDLLVIADAGLPVPKDVERIDLAVTEGVPGLLDVARAVAGDLQVEQIFVATELAQRNQAFIEQVRVLFPDVPISNVPHDEFKKMTTSARAVVRTSECTPYANILLRSGVIF